VGKSAAVLGYNLDQAENYAGRLVGTTLKRSDYAGMARALGAYREQILLAAHARQ
jgi:acetolactate synthase I/II/III large subunit